MSRFLLKVSRKMSIKLFEFRLKNQHQRFMSKHSENSRIYHRTLPTFPRQESKIYMWNHITKDRRFTREFLRIPFPWKVWFEKQTWWKVCDWSQSQQSKLLLMIGVKKRFRTLIEFVLNVKKKLTVSENKRTIIDGCSFETRSN